MEKRVMVAMSGGVDSSVGAYLLKKQGYDVVGVTMCLGMTGEEGESRCCGPEAIEDARRVASQIGIPHYVLDFSRELETMVMQPFIEGYLHGYTPNPCALCNRLIKFGQLLERARTLGFDFLATGHYARLVSTGGRLFLAKPADKRKDQTYFLGMIRQDTLPFLLFPLSEYTKEEVRQIAHQVELHNAEKPASQEICFVRGKSYRELIEQRTSAQVSGLIVDGAGKPVGRHEGVYHFTVGQRKGMGIGFGKRQYIIDIHPEKNEVVIGEQEELDVKGFTATGVNLFVEHLPPESSVKTRYSHDEKPCYVEFQSNTVVVHFPHPQRFVSPGQVGVFYEGDRVIGAAPITALIR